MKAKSMSISAKCSDMFGGTIKDEEGNDLFEYDGYVPDFFPGDHYGDYIQLDIDLDTGRITNWKKPTAKDIAEMKKESER